MKVLRIVLCFNIALSLSSCAAQSEVKECRENFSFKKKFFFSISVLEKYTTESTIVQKHTISEQDFLKYLNFVSKWTKVPVGNVYNYNIGYLNLEAFNKQKKEWLNWYEINKCNNIH